LFVTQHENIKKFFQGELQNRKPIKIDFSK